MPVQDNRFVLYSIHVVSKRVVRLKSVGDHADSIFSLPDAGITRVTWPGLF